MKPTIQLTNKTNPNLILAPKPAPVSKKVFLNTVAQTPKSKALIKQEV